MHALEMQERMKQFTKAIKICYKGTACMMAFGMHACNQALCLAPQATLRTGPIRTTVKPWPATPQPKRPKRREGPADIAFESTKTRSQKLVCILQIVAGCTSLTKPLSPLTSLKKTQPPQCLLCPPRPLGPPSWPTPLALATRAPSTTLALAPSRLAPA